MIVESVLFDKLRELAGDLVSLFDTKMTRVDNPNHTADLEGWTDWFWESDSIRKGHLKIIEPVGKNKLWLLNISPEL